MLASKYLGAWQEGRKNLERSGDRPVAELTQQPNGGYGLVKARLYAGVWVLIAVISGTSLVGVADESPAGASEPINERAGERAGDSTQSHGSGSNKDKAPASYDQADTDGEEAAPDEAGNAAADGSTEQQAVSGKADLFAHVTARARRLAEQAYNEPSTGLPEALTAMDYAQYRAIRFRQEHALWADRSLFHVEFFHPGFLYETPVTIHEVTSEGARELVFDNQAFAYGDGAEGMAAIADAAASLDSGTGYAGFRFHYPLNSQQVADEMMVFLGASYLRLVGPGQDYGLSARGLAIDTAESSGEEFPAFREFWLVRPEADATRLRVYALLDSPSVTGAYRFDIRPGSEVRVDIASRIFARRDVGKLGVAPLTSMFLYGENSARHSDDFRRQVHDSDGLLLHRAGGAWLWRPLTNPSSLRVTSHPGNAPVGFGLAQRERDFEQYLDAQARYDRRPSLWVEPTGGDWGKGRVELVEIPSDSETNDNIVAYWVPAEALSAGDSRRYDYRLATFGGQRPGHDLARVVRTRNGWGAVPGASDPPPKTKRQFIVDFEGGRLGRLGEELPVEPVLETTSGEIENLTASRLPDSDQWRVSFKLSPEGDKPADMRLHLELRDERLTETWNYVWTNDDRR